MSKSEIEAVIRKSIDEAFEANEIPYNSQMVANIWLQERSLGMISARHFSCNPNRGAGVDITKFHPYAKAIAARIPVGGETLEVKVANPLSKIDITVSAKTRRLDGTSVRRRNT